MARIDFIAVAILLPVVLARVYGTRSQPLCTYTFQVPRSNSGCQGEGQATVDTNTKLQELREFLNNQHSILEQKLAIITGKLTQIGQRDSNQTQDEKDSQNIANTANGANYVQWGKTTCPGSARIIYEGYAGKSLHTQGGGANYLCLPKDPEFPDRASQGHQSESYMYGVEYEVHGSPVADQNLHNMDAPCAVCEARGRHHVLMIPAKRTCPTGWTKEYFGLLMTQHHSQRSADFVCVADGAEKREAGRGNEDGGLLYVVEAMCGSLPCPPYRNGYEFSCVVCTK